MVGVEGAGFLYFLGYIHNTKTSMVEKHRAVPTKKKSVVNHGPSILADLARPRPVGTRTETVPVDQKKSPMPCLRKGWRLVRHGSKTSIWAMRYRGMDWLLFGMVLLFGMLQRDPGVSSQFAKVGEGYCASSRSVDVIPYAVTAAGYSSCASACYQVSNGAGWYTNLICACGRWWHCYV